MNSALPVIPPRSRLLTAVEFQGLAAVPAEAEWFANITSSATRRAYENAIKDFMAFTGIARPDEFRAVVREHVIAWRDDLASRALSAATVRNRLAALSSLFEHLCNSNAVAHNPVKGVKRPPVDSYEGKTPAIGDYQARKLLEAPKEDALKGKRDRAIIATLLYHALRRHELCQLTVKDFKHERRGVAHLRVSGKGGKTRFVPLHPAASGLINDYLAGGRPRRRRDRCPLPAAASAARPGVARIDHTGRRLQDRTALLCPSGLQDRRTCASSDGRDQRP